MPHLAQRQRKVLAGSGKRSKRPVVRAYGGEGAHHRLASVEVAGADDPDIRRRHGPPCQEVVLEFLGRAERPPLRVIGPGDAVGVLLGHGLEVPLVEGLVTCPVGLDVAGCHGSSCSFLVASSFASGTRKSPGRLSAALLSAIVGPRPCRYVGQQVAETLKPTLRAWRGFSWAGGSRRQKETPGRVMASWWSLAAPGAPGAACPAAPGATTRRTSQADCQRPPTPDDHRALRAAGCDGYWVACRLVLAAAGGGSIRARPGFRPTGQIWCTGTAEPSDASYSPGGPYAPRCGRTDHSVPGARSARRACLLDAFSSRAHPGEFRNCFIITGARSR